MLAEWSRRIPMATMTKDLKHDLDQMIASLQQLRDRIRLKIHLAGMDAKTEWEKIERDLENAEQVAERTTHEGERAIAKRLEELGKKLEAFAKTLG
jgi:uncharacterized coiled-coil DUF342 family protein